MAADELPGSMPLPQQSANTLVSTATVQMQLLTIPRDAHQQHPLESTAQWTVPIQGHTSVPIWQHVDPKLRAGAVPSHQSQP